MSRIRIGTGPLTAEIDEQGAELCSLRYRPEGRGEGTELLWQAERAWPWHAPLLFPVIGRMNGDRLRHDGTLHPMPKHGFARDRRFTVERHDGTSAVLTLKDDAESRRLFPFPFRLTVGYAVEGGRLDVSYSVHNPGPGTLSASLGVHPGFRWPLPGAAGKRDHAVVFERPEPAPVRRVEDVLLLPERHPTPVHGRTLRLDEALFTDGALILDAVDSAWLTYGAPGSPTVTLSWHGFRQLTLWSPPRVDLLCIEPWYGLPSPAGPDGENAENAEYTAKPGQFHLSAGRSRRFGLGVEIRTAR
ncbi:MULTISPECIES: aldose 1-epimerase family protein [Streptomyces]|uniref:Aldose 1-epimerase family protein n=1 Tax=Streptomyces lonegramiae TaxID=3075524 RepID=A0ABU2X7R3_9ACTN|nr:aldose 1-epimerase family protein [Streptomyces sp. DSM 41529]MDT0541857.1 aldose 1-epimerase family protein [Streptomyces sp. DSM 41529]